MISIIVNEKQHQFLPTTSLLAILEQLEIAPQGIAVAINETIISKTDWSHTLMRANDKVLIIKATQGG